MSLNRFNRQIILPEVGKEGQDRLKSARVLCVGVGGLGSPASLYLAAAGVGTLGLIDPDTVDLTNLQRQVLFRSSDEGQPKVQAAKARLQELYPEILVETYQEPLRANNAEQLFRSYDLVIDGTDNFAAKFLINDAACKFQIPMIYGTVNGFEGQAALFFGKQGACYRCLYRDAPQAQIRNCAESGVLGSVVGVIGTLQATLALEYLISQGFASHPLCPKVGSLMLFDLRGSFSTRSVLVPKHPKCPTCSLPVEKIQLPEDSVDACQRVNQIRAEELKRFLLSAHPKVFLLDVREKDEWKAGHLEMAHHFPLSRIENGELPTLPADLEKIVVYCQSGVRSAVAASILTQASAEAQAPIYNLIGGLNLWTGPLAQD